MKKMGLNEIRSSFLKFFEGKGHLVLPSFSLVPEKDKSLLLINSGMAPMKAYFTGQEKPPRRRITTCQKCIRTPDIERVGKTARHGTFFEMLGNFSFGDYFKKEAIEWAWEYVTEELGLPEDRLWITIYHEDDEAFKIWSEDIGVSPDRIVRMGKEDNFWEIGVGPCGPCSEIHYDRGEEYGCGKEDCAIGCECDRFIEFWNLVFTQFYRDEEGNYTPLKHPNIDTGMGLERIAAIMQGVDSLFEVDTIRNIMKEVSNISNIEYGQDPKADISLRVITDHIRGTTFMISDGILPSNEGRGYVLRRLLRRAARHGKLLGIKDLFLDQVAKVVIEESKQAYPELEERKDYILKVIRLEEERFNETIDQGLEILKQYVAEMKQNDIKVLDGEKAFRLYDTYGFPIDLTKEILEEDGLSVDEQGFEREMENQRERARAARHDTDYMGEDDQTYKLIPTDVSTVFEGYESLETDSQILVIIKDEEKVETAREGDEILFVMDKTPFYAESGGQIGDSGVVENENVKVRVDDTQKIVGNRIVHRGVVIEGSLNTGDMVKAKVDEERRIATARNHSATHLLHKALREVLGSHVEQAGSLVTPSRLRFDFSHFAPLTKEEIEKVEQLVNEKILEGLAIEVFETSLSKAKELGAAALFGEKYKDVVRVVKMGDFSIELCGGTHLRNTAQAGLFKIISESGVAAGVRRIEAVTGAAVYQRIKELENTINDIAEELKTNPNNIVQRLKSISKQLKEYEKEIDKFKAELAKSSIDDLLKNTKKIGDMTYITAELSGQDAKGLREAADLIRDRIKSGVVVLASESQGKVLFVAAATKDAVAKGVHAGNLLREVAKIAGGGGGGRPDMAQAGGKDPSKISEALQKVDVLLKEQLGIN